MASGTLEATLPRIGNNLVQSNLDHYLVTFCFKNNIRTRDQLVMEILKPASYILKQLEPIDTRKLVQAFFSLN